jgi:hypothetical protein
MPDIFRTRISPLNVAEHYIATTTIAFVLALALTFATVHSDRIRFKKLGNEAVGQIDKFRKGQDARMPPKNMGIGRQMLIELRYCVTSRRRIRVIVIVELAPASWWCFVHLE